MLIGAVPLAVIGVAAAALLVAGSNPARRREISATVAPGNVFACSLTRVRYTPAPKFGSVRLPPGMAWVSLAGRRIVATLGYYPMPAFLGLRRMVIPTDADAGNGAVPKVLWSVRGRPVAGIDIRGRRLDAPGSFHQHLSPLSGRVGTAFASIVDVPSAGCWVLHVRAGATSGSLTFQAVALVS
jgi:hypothetical protein